MNKLPRALFIKSWTISSRLLELPTNSSVSANPPTLTSLQNTPVWNVKYFILLGSPPPSKKSIEHKVWKNRASSLLQNVQEIKLVWIIIFFGRTNIEWMLGWEIFPAKTCTHSHENAYAVLFLKSSPTRFTVQSSSFYFRGNNKSVNGGNKLSALYFWIFTR